MEQEFLLNFPTVGNDDFLVIDNDGVHAPVELSTTIDLTAGVHSLEVRYFENVGGAVVDLDWSGPGFAREQMMFEVGVNEPPVATDDTASTVSDVAVDIDVLANDTDPEGQLLTITGTTQGANGTVSINPDGTLRYLPDDGFTGSDSFTYDVTDGTSTVGATVDVTVSSQSLNEVTGTHRVERLVGTEGPDILNSLIGWGDILVGLGGADIFDFSTTSLDGVKERKYIEDFNAAEGDVIRLGAAVVDRYFARGDDLHIVLVGDSDKIVLQGVSTFDPSYLEGAGGEPPIAVADAYSLAEDGSLTVDAPGVIANDSDPEGNTLSATVADDVDHGQLSFNANGSFTYVPDPDFFGTDSFTYALSNSVGGTAIGTVELEVTPESDPPDALDDVARGDVDTALDINVLGNDSDPDGDTLTVVDVSQGSFGTVSINGDGTLRYVPDAGFTGTDTFTYQIADPAGNGATANVEVDIGTTEVNVITGTHRIERLVGTEGDDILNSLIGWGDVLVGLGGADVFDFSTTALDGIKERKYIEDFNFAEGDLIDIGSATVNRYFTRSDGLHIVLVGDSDKIVLEGVDVYDTGYFV